MRKRTSTKQLNSAITNNLLHIVKAKIYSKTSRKTEEITPDSFKDSLDFLCETIFSDAIGWYYERDYKTEKYEVECGRMNPNTDLIVIAHLSVCEGTSREDIDKTLRIVEED